VSIILVEAEFPNALTDADLQAAAARQAPCMQAHDVQWKRSLMSGDRRRMICEYEAADAESVRKVRREANVPFEKAWVATAIV
jgi:hypothetical protein